MDDGGKRPEIDSKRSERSSNETESLELLMSCDVLRNMESLWVVDVQKGKATKFNEVLKVLKDVFLVGFVPGL